MKCCRRLDHKRRLLSEIPLETFKTSACFQDAANQYCCCHNSPEYSTALKTYIVILAAVQRWRLIDHVSLWLAAGEGNYMVITWQRCFFPCVYTHARTHIYTNCIYKCIYTHTHTYTYMYVCMWKEIHVPFRLFCEDKRQEKKEMRKRRYFVFELPWLEFLARNKRKGGLNVVNV